MAARKPRSTQPTDASKPADPAAKPADPRGGRREAPPEQVEPKFPIVGIGASAGGLEAFTQLLGGLPVDTGMAFVFVTHLSPTHASMLSEILARATEMPVTEVKDEPEVLPNHVYVIPPDRSMVISDGKLQLLPRNKTKSPHRPVDYFLTSLADDQGHSAIGVILSGTATDGTVGLEEIKAAGGITFAQDDSAQYVGMPHSAIAAGCVDVVLPPHDIAAELARIAQHPFIAPTEAPEKAAGEAQLVKVLQILHRGTGMDFSGYKRSTLYRRITRRIVLHKLDGLADYSRFLQANPAELEALFQEILVSVTHFFRNPEAFEALKKVVFPKLVVDRSPLMPVRIWVLGCSTGEEAYSIAIAFTEFIESIGRIIPVQIFASDLNGRLIERARAGVYAPSITQDVSPERLRRFFTETDGGYRIIKSIRDMCVFANHNGLTDPPFSHMDVISCRNLLIYLEEATQQKILPMLHYALNPGGYLWLGGAETIGAHRDLFDLVEPSQKIYVKKPSHRRPALHFPLAGTITGLSQRAEASKLMALEDVERAPDVYREADRLILARYAPAGVLVNSDMEILQFRGNTGLYLAPAPGKASLNLLKMLREGLLIGVRAAIVRARREDGPVIEPGLRVKANGGSREVNVEVLPIKARSGRDTAFLVLFEDPSRQGALPAAPDATPPDPLPAEQEGMDHELRGLKQDLAATREYLQSVIEQQEAANEELQSANEEVQSANEELQSINEELETSKEEIQSSNEELATVNDELHARNSELTVINNDLVNLLASVQMAIVMLGPDLRIRRFTPIAERTLNLIAADVGRPITDIQLNLDVPHLDDLLTEVIDTMAAKELEIQDKRGQWYSLRLRPYRTVENRIDGAVMLLVDINALKQAQEQIGRHAKLLDQTSDSIFSWESDGTIIYWNRGAQLLYGYRADEAVGRNCHQLLATHELPGVESFETMLERESQWSGELIHTTKDGRRLVVETRQSVIYEPDGRRLVMQTNRDVTDRKRLEADLLQSVEEMARSQRSKDEFLAMLAHELRNPLAALRVAAQLMRSSAADPVVVERTAGQMDRQIASMARMVDDLLDVSRITHGKIELQTRPVDLLALVAAQVRQLEPSFAARGLALWATLPAEPIHLIADPVRVEQILDNLLGNAAKFTDPGGRVEVVVERVDGDAARDKPATAVIHVRDNGSGIAPELLPQVFDLFVQGDPPMDIGHSGLGIGLTLVRRLVEMHGGRIEVHSDGPMRGSEFTFSLPLVGDGTDATPPGAPRRVLVVDDRVDTAEGQATLLRMAGHETRVAHSGPQALEVAAAFRPHVVLLDLGLPGIDGFEVARRLRRAPETSGTMIVAISGYGQDADRARALEAGCDRYLVKPADPKAVLDLVARSPAS